MTDYSVTGLGLSDKFSGLSSGLYNPDQPLNSQLEALGAGTPPIIVIDAGVVYADENGTLNADGVETFTEAQQTHIAEQQAQGAVAVPRPVKFGDTQGFDLSARGAEIEDVHKAFMAAYDASPVKHETSNPPSTDKGSDMKASFGSAADSLTTPSFKTTENDLPATQPAMDHKDI